jgi:glycosyltransferase involved in cell wall biosynthesis
MKVLFIAEYYPPIIKGGGEINLALLATALARNGVEVAVLTSHQKKLDRSETVEGVRIFRKLRTGKNPGGLFGNFKRSLTLKKSIVRQVKKLLKNENFNYLHFIGASILAAPHIKGVPLAATIESYPTLCPKGDRIYHGREECKIKCSALNFISCQMDSQEIGKMKNRFFLKFNVLFLGYVYNHHYALKKSLKYCKLIAISNYMQKLLRYHGLESSVIPNMIDSSSFKNVSIKKESPRVTYLGSLIKSKGPDIFVKALSGLDCQGKLYGEGNMKNELNRMINSYNLNAAIHKPVEYKDVHKIYEASEIIVFPSRWPEPFGRIALEAMAAGKPVIGSDIGGIQETIEPGVGLLVKPGHVGALRDALSKLLGDAKLRRKMGELGRLKVAKYQEEVILKKLLDFYNGK